MAPSLRTPIAGEQAPRSPRRAAAADGAPVHMEVDAGASPAGRVFCPVACCPCAGPLRAHSKRAMSALVVVSRAGFLKDPGLQCLHLLNPKPVRSSPASRARLRAGVQA